MGSDPHGTAAWFRRAATELAATSDLQVAWSRGVAADPEVLALVEQLPREHRQPSLLFSVARLLGAPPAPYDEWRTWLVAEWPRVAALARERRTQTNEVQRCAPLLAALDRIEGPLALVELGASAGLCLGVDRYAYRFDDGPVLGEPGAAPLLTCTTTGTGAAPARLPDVAWRVGVDLHPLDSRDPDDLAWLEALLPPDRPERRERLHAATARLAGDPPRLVAGDALTELPALAAAAPAGAALVVVSLGTAVYLPPEDRARLPGLVRELGARLVTLESVAALPEVQAGLAGRTAPEPTPFLLAVDGIPIAYSSAHGDRLSWLSAAGEPGGGAPPP